MDSHIMEFRQILSTKLNPMRYEHSLSVSYTCIALAMRYGYDIDKAELAGLLHDCAKRYRDTAIIEKCRQKGLELTDSELKAPAVLHAKYGAWMARHKYHIEDEEILSAILYHTTGRPNMSLLEKILYAADYIEPRRYKAAQLEELRQLAFEDLDKAVYLMMKGTLSYLSDKGCFVDPMTQDAYEYYRTQKEGV